MKGHNDPHNLIWEEGRTPQEARIRRVENDVKHEGQKSELSTTTNGSTEEMPSSFLFWEGSNQRLTHTLLFSPHPRGFDG